MSALPLFLLSQFALACPATSGFPASHVVDRVTATAQTESGLQTTSVHDNTSHRSYVPATAADAVRLVAALHAQGHSLDAGVMQVNDGNWPRLGLTAETVFDPRANICAGMALLAEAYASVVQGPGVWTYRPQPRPGSGDADVVGVSSGYV